jgi:hypothetical protein
MKYSIHIFAVAAILMISCTKAPKIESDETNNLKTEHEQAKALGFDTSVYILEEGKLVVLNHDKLKAYWREALASDFPDQKLFKELQLQSFTSETGVETWLLSSLSEDGRAHIGTILDYVDDILFIGEGKTYKCEGCANGFNLTTSGNTCYCSGCNPSTGQCTKTETAVVRS